MYAKWILYLSRYWDWQKEMWHKSHVENERTAPIPRVTKWNRTSIARTVNFITNEPVSKTLVNFRFAHTYLHETTLSVLFLTWYANCMKSILLADDLAFKLNFITEESRSFTIFFTVIFSHRYWSDTSIKRIS